MVSTCTQTKAAHVIAVNLPQFNSGFVHHMLCAFEPELKRRTWQIRRQVQQLWLALVMRTKRKLTWLAWHMTKGVLGGFHGSSTSVVMAPERYLHL